MKRKLLLFSFLLVYCLGFSQSELYVLHKDLPKPVLSSCDNIWGYDEKYYINLNSYYSYKTGEYVIESSLPLKVKVSSHAQYDSCPPGTNCGGSLCCQENVYGVSLDENLNLFDEVRKNEGNKVSCEKFSIAKPELNYYAVLLPKITTPTDRRCERNPLFDQYSDGQNHNVTGLVWEYIDKNGNWKELPNYKNRYPLNVSLLDVFGTNWRNKFKGNLQLRFKFTAPFTNDVVYSIQNYTITLTECSPDFKSYYNLSNTSCSYKSDGNIGVKLSNNINSTEQLVVTLFKKDSNGDILINQYSTKQLSSTDKTVLVLEDLGGGFFGFNWPEYIDAGTYYFRYQVLSKATTPSKPKATDPFWYTLVKTPKFTIKKATNVDFTAKRFSDENCFNSGDGKIRVYNVSGGTGEGYEYELNEDNNWTPFNPSNKNIKEVVIEGLGKGTYKIKIRDSKKCLAKE